VADAEGEVALGGDGAASGATGRAGVRVTRRDVPAAVITGLGLCFVLAPLAALAIRSLKTSDGWGLGNYARLAVAGAVAGVPGSALGTAGRSLLIALQAAVLALVLGLLVAYVLSRSPRGAGLIDAVFMAPLGISAVTVGFGFLITLDHPPFDLRTSPLLLPIAQALVALPLVVRTVLPVLRGIDPRLRQAGAALGVGPGRVLATVDVPLAARSVGLAAGLAFAVALGEFGATTFLARPETTTLPVAIYRLIGRPGLDNFGTALAGCVLLAAMTGVVMAVAERVAAVRPGGRSARGRLGLGRAAGRSL
jgi:thiamine transport system permease protein